MEDVEPQDVFGQVHVFLSAEYPTRHGFLVSLIILTFPLFESTVKVFPSGCVSPGET